MRYFKFKSDIYVELLQRVFKSESFVAYDEVNEKSYYMRHSETPGKDSIDLMFDIHDVVIDLGKLDEVKWEEISIERFLSEVFCRISDLTRSQLLFIDKSESKYFKSENNS